MSFVPDFIQQELDKVRSIYDVPVLGGALGGLDALYRGTIEAPEGLFGIGLQKVAEGLGGGRGREEAAVTSAVTAETDKIENPILRALATPFLYGAAASEAKRVSVERAKERGDLPSVDTPLGRISPLEVAEMALPIGGLVQAGGRAPALARAITRGPATPKGVMATRMDDLLSQGLTPEQAHSALAHEYGQVKALEFATTGNDFFVSAPPLPVAPQAAAVAGRAAGSAAREFEQVRPGQFGEAPRAFEQGARAEGFRPTEVGPKMGTGKPKDNLGVNLDKIDAPPETKDYIKQVAEENAGFVEQRRGVVTTAETEAFALQIQVDAAKYAHIQPGTALNAEQITAVRNAMVAKGNEVSRLQEVVRVEQAAGVVSKETQLRLIAAATEHQTLQRVYAGARAESGRALRIQREIANGLGRGDINATYERAMEMLGGKDIGEAQIKALQKIWTDPSLGPVEREVATYRYVQNMDRASTLDKVQEFWINSILSAPTTHAVNIIGQTLLGLADMSTNFIAALVDVPASVIGRRPRERYFSGAFGALSSLGDGFRRARVMLRDADAIAATKFRETGQLARGQAIGSGFNASRAERGIGAVVNAPTKLLGAEDVVFRAFGRARGLHESAYNIAAREGLRPFSSQFAQRVSALIANPTDEMLAYSKNIELRAALRQEPGKITRALIKLRDTGFNTPIGEFKPLRYAIPFIQTPVNLVKVGAEYSPLGFVRAITAKGGARSDTIARAALGSAAMGFFAQQYAAGFITAGPPRDPGERDLFYASGKIPYAVKVGDRWVSFQRLEPISTPLKWTAAMMQQAQESPGQSWDVVAGKMVFALARQMEDSTYLAGLSDLIDALQDPSKAEKFFGRIASGFVPRVASTAVQSSDPYIRDPQNILQQVFAALPYLNETVPVKETALGPAERSEGKQGVLGYLSPVDFNTEQSDPEREFIAKYKLPESIGPDGNLLPARSLNISTVGQDIANFRLSDDEGRRYQQLASQATKNLIRDLREDRLLYEDRPFSQLVYEDQIRAIRKAIADARQVARAQVADEIIDSAQNDGQVARGAVMRLTTLGKLRDRARFIEGLDRQGRLSPEVSRLIDERRGDDPPARDMAKAVSVINDYMAEPPYIIGDPIEWDRMRKARAAAENYARETDKPAGVADWQWYFQVDPEGALLIRLYSRQNLRNRRRTELLRQYDWLERYVSGA